MSMDEDWLAKHYRLQREQEAKTREQNLIPLRPGETRNDRVNSNFEGFFGLLLFAVVVALVVGVVAAIVVG